MTPVSLYADYEFKIKSMKLGFKSEFSFKLVGEKNSWYTDSNTQNSVAQLTRDCVDELGSELTDNIL